MKPFQVYEPVEEGSYIKMIDMVSGKGGQIKVCMNSQVAHVKVISKVLFPVILLLYDCLIVQSWTGSFAYHTNTNISSRSICTVLKCKTNWLSAYIY